MLTHHKLKVAAASAVKAAAYLDLHHRKSLPARLETIHGGELLSRILAMLNRF